MRSLAGAKLTAQHANVPIYLPGEHCFISSRRSSSSHPDSRLDGLDSKSRDSKLDRNSATAQLLWSAHLREPHSTTRACTSVLNFTWAANSHNPHFLQMTDKRYLTVCVTGRVERLCMCVCKHASKHVFRCNTDNKTYLFLMGALSRLAFKTYCLKWQSKWHSSVYGGEALKQQQTAFALNVHLWLAYKNMWLVNKPFMNFVSITHTVGLCTYTRTDGNVCAHKYPRHKNANANKFTLDLK